MVFFLVIQATPKPISRKLIVPIGFLCMQRSLEDDVLSSAHSLSLDFDIKFMYNKIPALMPILLPNLPPRVISLHIVLSN